MPASSTTNVPQNDVGNPSGLCITCFLARPLDGLRHERFPARQYSIGGEPVRYVSEDPSDEWGNPVAQLHV